MALFLNGRAFRLMPTASIFALDGMNSQRLRWYRLDDSHRVSNTHS
jgi:hypothetical protein